MKVQQVGSNQTEVTLADGTCILFSYDQPVAALVPGKGWMRTERTHSVTTTKHVNRWLTSNASTYAKVDLVPQWDLDQLVAF